MVSTLRSLRRLAQRRFGQLPPECLNNLMALVKEHRLSLSHLALLNGSWYVTHSGLLKVAAQRRCRGIDVQAIREFCDLISNHWAFKATVYKSATCKGFVGYGDADPSNVSPQVRGAEMRVAETRAVNRALRKAYGIGLFGGGAGLVLRPASACPCEKTHTTGAAAKRQWSAPAARPAAPDHPPTRARSGVGQGLRRRLLRG